ncbi:MAG: hypothetical protein QG657_3731 [Acidobacteriota bacterium]|nr:hypothetical protein [Acidobacteriota bacterium]
MNTEIANYFKRFSSATRKENIFLPEDVTPDPRQRRKIVGSLFNPHIIWQPDTHISENEIETFIMDVARKLVTSADKQSIEKDFQELVAKVRGNILTLKCFPIFEKIRRDKHLTGILAYFTRGSLYRRDEVQELDVLVFLKKYPDPYGFQYEAQDFLDIIHLFNPPGKRKIYEKNLQTFMKLLYGKQYEYLMQINLIKREAGQIYSEKAKQLHEQIKTVSIAEIKETEGKEILKAAEIQGSPYKGRMLTLSDLAQNGLQPRYIMSFKGFAPAYFSSPYHIAQGRVAVIAYLKKDGQYIPGSFYQSNSHGIWRRLENYVMMEGRIVSYGAGEKRGAANLPLVFQKALAEITNNPNLIINLDHEESDFIFAGVAHSTLSLLSRNSTAAESEIKEKQPEKLDGNIYNENDRLIAPEEVDFHDRRQAPDFSKQVIHWEAVNKLYGKTTYKAFLSGDDRFVYTFCKDERDRAWIGCIENHSAICADGPRETWVDGGCLATPAYEYLGREGNYGNPELRIGNYIDMFKNYLSKVRIIALYANNPEI